MKAIQILWVLLISLCSSLYVSAQPVADFTTNVVSGCAPILVQFTDQSTGTPTSWHWNLGNNTTSTLQNPSTTYFNPGTYTISLTVSNASGTDTRTMVNYITVVAPPVVLFAADDTVASCVPATVQFTDLSSLNAPGAGSYFWDFGDGNTSTLQNPVHTYTNTGNYSVTLSIVNSSGCSRTFTKQNYIHVVPKPVADFTTPVTGSCAPPFTVNFNNTSSGATSYFWDLGNGNTSVAANPSAVYTTQGTYNVTLIATLGNCKDTMIKPAYISIGSPAASFTPSSSATCTGNTINFTNTSLPGPGNSSWDFGDGSTATGANASHVYATPGTYTVTLIVDYNSCSDTATQTITVNQGPNVQFSATQTSGCALPFSTQFNNASTGAVSYLWDFGDGNTSTAANPAHTYTGLGNYTVTLTAISANGCSTTVAMTNYISVYQPFMTVSPIPPGGCVPATITFQTAVTPNVPVTGYVWDFGDGTTVAGGGTMNHTYSATGNYTVSVTYTVGQGCTYTSAPVIVRVGEPVTSNFTGFPLTICPEGTVQFTNTSTGPPGTTYQWFFGDGGVSTQTNPDHTYNGQGTYAVTLIAHNNGCADTLTIPNMVQVDPPDADFTFIYSCTNKLEVSFLDASIGASQWLWDFGDGTTSTQQNPVHTFSGFGTYVITLKVTHLPSGCESTHQSSVLLFDLSSDFIADNTAICKGETIQFTANPTAPAYLSSCDWYFGDGTSLLLTGISPTHTYSASGIYTVTLVSRDVRNCLDTFERVQYITVNSPDAGFTATPLSGCVPLTVNFTDQSNGNGNTITDRIWRFGDGNSLGGNQLNPVYTYTQAGTYTATLVVEDVLGCKDSLIRTGYIEAVKPLASFSASDTNICPGNTVQFVNNSTGNSLSYVWDFGDGNTSTAASPSHIYTASGNYTVSLIVTDGGSCSDTLIRDAYIKVSVINIGFTPSTTLAPCPPLTVSFTNTSTGVSGYSWDFGNGSFSSLPSPSTVYTLPGTYTVKLKGQNGSGCIDSVMQTITVLGPTGTFSYSPLNGCLPLTIQFSSTNSNTQSLIWDMDNGFTQTTTSSSYTYTYTTPGTYVPRLLLSDGVSCIVPIVGSDTIRVDQLQADFTFSPATVCQSGTIQFTDTALYHVNPVVYWNWDFGDGNGSTLHNPSHTYTAPGVYTVTLTMGTSQNCYDTVVKTVTIHTPPIVNAGQDQDFCQSLNLQAQLQATGAQSYSWSPAGGLSCTNCPDPIASPTVTTTYTVVGTAANGCTDTSDVTINVHPLPNLTTGPPPDICIGASVQLAVTGAQSYSWSPATDLSCTNCSNPTASPAVTTTYTVTGTDANGCSNSEQITVTVKPLPVLAVAGNTALCSGETTQLTASGADTYSWSPGTGLSCTACPDPVASPAVTTTYIVSGTADGCTDTAQVTVTVNPLPPVAAGPPQDVCAGNTAQLQATGADTYSWSPATGLSCTSCPDPVATLTSNETYTVTGTDANGCTASSSVTVTVHPLPSVSVGPDQTVCSGTPAALTATGANTYSWTPATDLSCTACPNPAASPAATTTYTVVGTDVNGCKDTAQVTVFVDPLPVVTVSPDVAICSLGTAQLQAGGTQQYSWAPAAGLSCTNCPDPVASPALSTTYTVTGTDANGCSNTAEVTVSLYPSPNINAGPDQVICHGQTLQLHASGGISYSWSPAVSLSCTTCPDPLAAPTQDVTYTLTGVDANGCSDSDKITITVIQMQPFVIGEGDTLCQGESVQLHVSGGDEYLWLPPDGLSDNTSSDPVATPEVTTNYTIIIRQGSCFSDTGYITVFVYPMPAVDAGSDQTILAGNSVQLYAQSTHTDQYQWLPDQGLSCDQCQSPVASPGVTTTYKVIASNYFGCKAEDEVTIFIRCDNSTLFFANTFTPNGDGNNDRFYPQGKGISSVSRFRIYNRWGELVYDVQNISLNNELQGWDGTFKGVPLTPDVYIYVVDAICTTGEPMQLKGDISLIR